jgi:hypothetical protein
MTSPRSVEIKLGAKKPLKPEEAKRCELKPSMEIKRTAHIRCGGRVPTGPISSRYHVKEERVSTPVCRPKRIRGMKRKDYKEESLEPKDYEGIDYSDDRSPRSWAAARRDDNDLFYWEEVPKEKPPEGPNGGGDPDDGGNGDNEDDPGYVNPFGTDMLCDLPSLHLGSLRVGRGVFPRYGGNKATYGRFGMSSR